jgi:hypothetical protein
MLVRCSIVLLIILAALVPCVNGAECKNDYQSIIFPTGMPTGKGWDGQSRPEQFKCYAEAPIAEGVTAVLFSTETLTGSADNLFKVRLVTLSSRGTPVLLDSIELTSSIPVFVEQPGNFLRMNATLETVTTRQGIRLVHVNEWAVLSGSGSISGGSDLFFIYASQSRLSTALELRNSSSFSRVGIGAVSKKGSDLFLSTSNQETILYVQSRAAQVINSAPTPVSENINVYVLRMGKFERSTMQVNRVPNAAAKLQRVPEILALMSDPKPF